MYEVLIEKGIVVDGTGNPWFKADVAVEKGKIVALGDLTPASADTVINAEGMVVCPGFIDMHSHSDFTLLMNPLAESKVRQGVTTEVIGNCGLSAAPLNDLLKKEVWETSPLLRESGLELAWSTMSGYMELMQSRGVSLNVVPLVGNSNIRVSSLGFENGRPSVEEMEEMKKVLAGCMEDGAFGISTGLIYAPSCYADTDEIVELAKVAAMYGGIYTSHIRGEGRSLINAVKEAIEIGEKASIPVEISHHKASGKANWGNVRKTLKIMQEARQRLVDVTCDVYPYTAGSTGLDALIPSTFHEGGVEKMVERLKSPGIRRRIRREMAQPAAENKLDSLGILDWKKIFIAYCKGHPEFEGRNIQEISTERNVDPFDFVFNLLIEENASVNIVLFTMSEEDMEYVLSHRLSMIGSDSSARATYGILAKGKPHPRAYGTFPRILGRYVRDKAILTLEEAVRKMTSFPAQKLRLRGRGLVKVGMWADIVIIESEQVVDLATYQKPHQYPEGIRYVFVNGKLVVEEGEHTKSLPGEVLRHTWQA